MRTIAIIGGGFSGCMTAVNLARFCEESLQVFIINSLRPFARGTAYGTNRPEHLLNVAARNMSAIPDHPLHYFHWLRSRNEFNHIPDAELREMFTPRRVYGDYLRCMVENYLHPIDARCQVKLEEIDDLAIDIIPEENSGGTIQLLNGEPIKADYILLATGNEPPSHFQSQSPLLHDVRYSHDPWGNWFTRLPPNGSQIVLLGTGLTMVDVILTLDDLGWQGTITALSRHGMLPQSHFRGIAYPDYLPENAESLPLSELVQLVEQHCERLRQMSQNPAIAIDKLRPHTQSIWTSLSLEEKREFLSRYAARWNVTRHRIAVSIHEKITDALDRGSLHIVAGTIERLVPRELNIEVILREQSGETVTVAGDLIINCTGPQSSFSKTDNPLYRNLLDRGFVKADELNMGIEVDDNFAVLNSQAVPANWLYAIGPMLKGSLWETTAVPELRGQAMRVAQLLLEQEPVAPEEEYVIEYCI